MVAGWCQGARRRFEPRGDQPEC